jgi:hypothetical protein
MESNLGEVIDKALKQKLPKLARTRADKRILFLERRHMNLYPKSMLDEVEKRNRRARIWRGWTRFGSLRRCSTSAIPIFVSNGAKTIR